MVWGIHQALSEWKRNPAEGEAIFHRTLVDHDRYLYRFHYPLASSQIDPCSSGARGYSAYNMYSEQKVRESSKGTRRIPRSRRRR